MGRLKMSANLDQKLFKSNSIEKLDKRLLKKIKNSKVSSLNKLKKQPKPKNLSTVAKKELKFINDELKTHQKLCLNYIQNDLYKFKPSDKMIKNNQKLKDKN